MGDDGTNKDGELYTRIFQTSVAQHNFYASTPSEMYFSAKTEVLQMLTSDMHKYYEMNKAGEKEIEERNIIYMRFLQWLRSDEFKKQVGDKYQFGDPYIVGSAWTPLQKKDSIVDVVIRVYQKEDQVLSSIPVEVVEKFAKAMVLKFCQEKEEKVITKYQKITLTKKDFRIGIRLTANRHPPFAARITAALKQYDDFLENFSAFALFVKDFFSHIRRSGRGTEKLVVPSPHGINCLIIHFLQFYEMVPSFFHPGAHNGTNLLCFSLADIAKFNLPAYQNCTYQAYRDFQHARRDHEANTGELLVMFFFFYGYLVDMPHVQINVASSDMIPKSDVECVGLSMFDMEDMFGPVEVPDAYRLQFLCRDTCQLIKDAQNPSTIFDRLFRMRMDESFTVMRDRHMKVNAETRRALDTAFFNMMEESLEPKVVGESDGIECSKCENTTYYRSTGKKNKPKKEKKPKPVAPFSDEHHALKSWWQKPGNLATHPATKTTFAALNLRASKMFMMVTLPNPRRFEELITIFRPPECPKSRLPVIEDEMLEPNFIETCIPKPELFGYRVKSVCYSEMRELDNLRKMMKIVPFEMAVEHVEQPVEEGQEPGSELTEQFANELVGITIAADRFGSHLEQMQADFIAQLDASIRSKLPYTPLTEIQ